MWIALELREGYEVSLYQNWQNHKWNLSSGLVDKINRVFIPAAESSFYSCSGDFEGHCKLLIPGYLFVDIKDTSVIKRITSLEGVVSVLSFGEDECKPVPISSDEVGKMENKIKDLCKKMREDLGSCKTVKVIEGLYHSLTASVLHIDDNWIELEVSLRSTSKKVRLPIWFVEVES